MTTASCPFDGRTEEHTHGDGTTWTPLRQRPGDQPLPVRHDDGRPDVQTLVIDDVHARRLLGIQRYGTALQADNGRDAIRDAYEEALDLATYLRQVIAERDIVATAPNREPLEFTVRAIREEIRDALGIDPGPAVIAGVQQLAHALKVARGERDHFRHALKTTRAERDQLFDELDRLIGPPRETPTSRIGPPRRSIDNAGCGQPRSDEPDRVCALSPGHHGPWHADHHGAWTNDDTELAAAPVNGAQ